MSITINGVTYKATTETDLRAMVSALNVHSKMATAKACTACRTPVSLCEGWILWPWPDGAELCERCNDARHEAEDYSTVGLVQLTAGGAR